MSTGSQLSLRFSRSARPCAQHVQKHLLLMLVVAGIAGREFACPVQRQPDRPQLLLHRGDVVVGPGLRRDLALDRGVLGRQAEGVPAHRVQHVETLGAHEPRQHVAQGVIADMPDMDAPGRVGEHLEHVVFRPGSSFFEAKIAFSSHWRCQRGSESRAL
jgi:hypothetical protein